MRYYVYGHVIRENMENHILKCHQLYHQYMVYMYAKIESERFLLIHLNQYQLRSEEYIHLRDAINNDGNLSHLGQLKNLPAIYTGSQRHTYVCMYEYLQNAMAYNHNYGRADLFITSTCNPIWNEIKKFVLP